MLLFTTYQSATDAAGPYAAVLEKLWWFFFAICATVWVSVVIMLFVSFRKGLRRPAPDESVEGTRRSARWVALALTTTIGLLLVMLVASIVAGRRVSPIYDQPTREVRVTGHQWWWEVQYTNQRADLVLQSANEIHIPVGEQVKVILTSSDVIHSLWIPNLHGKRDLIPGKKAEITIQADKPGLYRAQCAEFCGFQHAKMALVVVAQTRAEFERWYRNELLPAPIPKTAEQQRGHQVFMTTTCVMCHAVKGTKAGARTGPDLTHVAARLTIGAGILTNNRGNLHGWIANAQSIKPGVLMPPNNFDSEDLHAVVAYLESLK